MGRARRVVRAQQLWFAILEAQIETGNPYMLYKDHCNRKSNQQVRICMQMSGCACARARARPAVQGPLQPQVQPAGAHE